MKMRYNEFKGALKAVLEERLRGEAEVCFRTMIRNNNIETESLVIEGTGKNVFPIISLTALYDAYSATEDFGECVGRVSELCEQKPLVSREDVPLTWEEAKKKIQMRLVKKEWNLRKLETVLYREYLDFAVIFYAVDNEEDGVQKSFIVSRERAREWKIGLNELWETALENLGNETFFIKDMESVLREITGWRLFEKPEDGKEAGGILYVMLNQNQSYAARGVLRKDLLRRLADEQKSSFYLLPSSVHEWILCKDDGSPENAEEMKRMVREVNANPDAVSPEDCLSDSIYYYDREQNEVRIVA